MILTSKRDTLANLESSSSSKPYLKGKIYATKETLFSLKDDIIICVQSSAATVDLKLFNVITSNFVRRTFQVWSTWCKYLISQSHVSIRFAEIVVEI